MDRPTFLDRRPLGIPNYLAVALVAVTLVALVPRGARLALESNTNQVEDWLPATYSESVDLAWFRNHFGGEGFVLASWDGCTLGSSEQLRLLAGKLRSEPLSAKQAAAAGVAPHADRRLFSRVVTGPEMIDRLMARPARLSEQAALARLSGAFFGPPTVKGDDSTRTTCLVAYLSPDAVANNRAMRGAIERLAEIAETECGITASSLHLGGPPVDNVAIDIEGERTLRTLAGLSGLVGLLLAYACFRSVRLTGMVLTVATLSAAASLAMVFYFGAFEVLVGGAENPRLGKLDAILMSMPAVVYVLSLSAAIHLVNYYRDASRSGGRRGAVERAVGMAFMPCAIATLTTAIGLASLASSDILPIEKFGVFSAIGVVVGLGLLLLILPVALHRFAPPIPAPTNASESRQQSLPHWARRLAEGICRRHSWVVAGAGAAMVLFALGLPRIESSVKLIKLLDSESDLVQDYAWLESHLGNLVPMEVVIAVPPRMCRDVNDHPEASGEHYAMTTFERLMLTRRIGDRIEALQPVSRVLDAATFAPAEYESRSPSNRRTHDYVMSRAMDENRDELTEFLRWEPTTSPTARPRELWRSSARITALGDIDYGQFVSELQNAVEPVLAAYRSRDALVAALAKQSKQLAGGKICLVVTSNPTTGDALLAELLREAGVNLTLDNQRGQLWTPTLEQLQAGDASTLQRLSEQDLIATLNTSIATRLAQLAGGETAIIDLASMAVPTETSDVEQIGAVYTGVMPLVYKTQRQLLTSLQESLVLAVGFISLVLMVLLRSIGGGLASMIPNLFPLVVVFGGLGWLGIKVDIGIMMTASVALGVAVDDTIHFVTWFRRGLRSGLARFDAAIDAYERCGVAMVQTTLIAGLGLAVFAFSTFTPTQQFGWLMVTILAAALVGDLVLLPALLVGPVGKLFPAAASNGIAADSNGDDYLLDGPDSPPAECFDQSRTANDPPAEQRPSGIVATVVAPEASAPDEHPYAENTIDEDDLLQGIAHQVDTMQVDDLLLDALPQEVSPPVSEMPVSETPVAEQSVTELTPANAALRARLRSFRRNTSSR